MTSRFGSLVALALLTPAASAQTLAIELDSPTEIVFPHDPIIDTDATATVEGWVRAVLPVGTDPVTVFLRYDGGNEHKHIDIWPAGEVRYLYTGSPWSPNFEQGQSCAPTSAGTVPIDGQFHHLAFVRRQSGDRHDSFAEGPAGVG